MTKPSEPAEPSKASTPPKAPKSLFDVRLLLSGLLGLYGLVLTIMGIAASDDALAKADGIRINLWTGLCLIVVSLAFLIWSLRRPFVPESENEPADESENESAGDGGVDGRNGRT